ncbi:type 1 glutamine amidotransferase [Anaerocolumna sp. AGMB13025]|uniref:type 1 glutamine amidotransferase n=1 Tax=Anaerocolumna sp. AGMB13025 TaxID=3039116 RepID=UPI00241E1446|nr:type 1 glutamine amidotransferase [Anaerocolumna sp. AGMB13025]WFR58752.1 type 1 glutamine amidotransferase [Anaerocolumna sp. AGMB13025]
MRLHYLQHVPFENPGSILTWAREKGYTVTSTEFFLEGSLPEQKDFDWLVIMGGPMNIYEEDKYPWLVKEKMFIKEAIRNGKVLIGLCLGGQLIADCIGGKVTKNTCKEIGWYPVRLTREAKESFLFSHFPKAPVVFEWHGDTFSSLPEEATLLAENDACAHQAFVYKTRIFGFQYHLENTLEIIKGLTKNCAEELVPDKYIQTEEELLSHPEYILKDNEWMTAFLERLEYMYEEGKL